MSRLLHDILKPSERRRRRRGEEDSDRASALRARARRWHEIDLNLASLEQFRRFRRLLPELAAARRYAQIRRDRWATAARRLDPFAGLL